MPENDAKWGIVSTIKAPLRTIADFAAYHIELGAHRLYIYLDDDNPIAYDALSAHPKIRVFKSDAANWRSENRPEMHQVRQVANARHAYHRKVEVDWLSHIDVDEFLLPDSTLVDQLNLLPKDCTCARIRPIEALSNEGLTDIPAGLTYFKAMTNDRAQRQRETEAIYPTYGAQLTGGFLSHVAGKLFFRTGIDGLSPKIHNVKLNKQLNPGMVELTTTRLCHMHAPSWDDWMRPYRYRLEKGVYRAELKPNRSRETGGMTMHELLSFIEGADGEQGLRRFYDEVCLATPELRARLDHYGLLHALTLDLDAKRARHFPELT